MTGTCSTSPSQAPPAALRYPQLRASHADPNQQLQPETRTLQSKPVRKNDLYDTIGSTSRQSPTGEKSPPLRSRSNSLSTILRTPSKTKSGTLLREVMLSPSSRPGSPRIRSSHGGVLGGSKRTPAVGVKQATTKQAYQACLDATALLRTVDPRSKTPHQDDSAALILDDNEVPLEVHAAAATQVAHEALTMYAKISERERLHLVTVS